MNSSTPSQEFSFTSRPTFATPTHIDKFVSVGIRQRQLNWPTNPGAPASTIRVMGDHQSRPTIILDWPASVDKSKEWRMLFDLLIAVRNTLKIMALVLYHTIRHPLSESVIDYDNATVYTKKVSGRDNT